MIEKGNYRTLAGAGQCKRGPGGFFAGDQQSGRGLGKLFCQCQSGTFGDAVAPRMGKNHIRLMAQSSFVDLQLLCIKALQWQVQRVGQGDYAWLIALVSNTCQCADLAGVDTGLGQRTVEQFQQGFNLTATLATQANRQNHAAY